MSSIKEKSQQFPSVLQNPLYNVSVDERYSKEHHKSILVILFIVIGVLFVVSIISIGVVSGKINTHNKTVFEDRTKTASMAFDTEDIKLLSGTKSDLKSIPYQKIKETLKILRSKNSDTRFVYLMTLNKDDKLVFLADSENEDSPDYSAPGDIYDETEQAEIDNYKSGGTIVVGPQKDRWGTWYSAEHIILENGTPLVMIGMDISAESWQNEILFIRASLAIVAVLLFSFLIILFIMLRKSVQTVETLSDANQALFSEREQLGKIEEIAGIGYFKETPSKNLISWDERSNQILGIEEGKKPSIENLENIIFHEDLSLFRQKVEDSIRFDLKETSFHFRIVRSDGMVRTIIAFCKINKPANGGPTNIEGTFQDITNV